MVYIFQRVVEEEKIIVVLNLSGMTYYNYHFRYGFGNSMKVIINSDWNKYGGSTPTVRRQYMVIKVILDLT